MPAEKRFNWLNAFRERLAIDSRVEAFEKQVRDRAAETGRPMVSLYPVVAKEYGYESSEVERELWDERHNVSSREAETKARERVRFAEALATLPAAVAPSRELEWVRSHPALVRQLQLGKKGTLELAVEDVLTPPHGPAPSQSAVQQLQVWAHDPTAFFKQIYAGKGPAAAAISSPDAAVDAEDSLAPERQTLDQTLDVLRQFNARACELARKAIGLKERA